MGNPSRFKVVGQSLHNFYIASYPIDNEWGIPELNRQDFDLSNAKWQSFSENRTCKCGDTIIHMFNEDYVINSVWTTPHKYLKTFSRLRAVCTPDFSLYTDMPKALMKMSKKKSTEKIDGAVALVMGLERAMLNERSV